MESALLGSALLLLLVLFTTVVLRTFPSLNAMVIGSEPPGREAELDGLRGILALLVVLHHGVIMHGFLGGGPWVLPAANFDSLAGPASVAIFFMASAYLFWGRVVRSGGVLDWSSFYAGRIRRLVPLYAGALALFLTLVAVQTQFKLRVPPRALLEQVIRWSSFGLMDLVDVNGLPNTFFIWSAIWSLNFEWLFYFLLPFFAFVYRALRWPAWLYASVIVMAGMFTSLTMVLFFALGAISVHAVTRCRSLPWMRWTFAAIGLGAMPLLVARFHEVKGYEPALLLFFIFVASLLGTGPWALLRWGPLRFLGHISYSVYLLHNPLLYAFCVFAIGSSRFGALRPLGLHCALLAMGALIIAISTATYLLIEKPFLRAAVVVKPSRS